MAICILPRFSRHRRDAVRVAVHGVPLVSIEQSEFARNFACRTFERAGYSCGHVTCGEDARGDESCIGGGPTLDAEESEKTRDEGFVVEKLIFLYLSLG